MIKITFEEFIISALLKFNRLDKFDIAYLIKVLKSNDIEVLKETKLDKLRFYIETKDGYTMINESITLKDEVDYSTSLEKYMRKHENKKVKEIFDNLDMKEFVLRKVEKYRSIADYQIKRIFNIEQESELYKLEDNRYISSKYNDDIPHDDYKEYYLSKKGELILFKKDYKKEIDTFIKLLNENKYDETLIDDFLMTQKLNKSPYNILTISNFLNFCYTYDRNPNKSITNELHFERLKTVPDTMLDENGKERMQDMLSVWDDAHCIHICHPNHIFDNIINKDNRTIDTIDWDNIDIDKMFNKKDYKTFILPSIKDAFRYVHKRLGNEIMTELKKGNKDVTSYLVVIEKYNIEWDNYYLVRGIIKGDKEGYSLAFNPEYEKVIPKSVWERSMRFSGNVVPEPYTLKRTLKQSK